MFKYVSNYGRELGVVTYVLWVRNCNYMWGSYEGYGNKGGCYL
jgi:hypothetical protein